MSHAGHGTKICQYGGHHGNCRCPDSAKIIRVSCDMEDQHRDVPAAAGYVPPGVEDGLAEQLTLEQILEGVKVSFWQCLIPSHRKRQGQTVRWMNGVAYCTLETCELNSEITREYAELVRDVVLEDTRKGVKHKPVVEPRAKLWPHDLKGRVLRLENQMIVVPVEFRGQSWSCVVLWCPEELENSYPRGGYDIIVFNGELTEAEEIEVGQG